MSLDGLGPALLVGLLAVVMLWFAFGTQRNIRRGNAILTWLQGGLPQLGSRTTLRWLGSSAVELGIAEAAAPFRDAEVVVVLEPRDVGLLWAYGHARGRRDFVIVRANLRRAPRFGLQVVDPHGWTAPRDGPADGWEPIAWPDGFPAHASAGADVAPAREAWADLREQTDGVWRLAIQPVIPHLEVHLRPPAPARVPAARLVGTIRGLAVRLAGD